MFESNKFFIILVFLLYISVLVILIKNATHKSLPPPPPPPPPNKIINGIVDQKLFGGVPMNPISCISNTNLLNQAVKLYGRAYTYDMSVINIYNDLYTWASIDLTPGKYLLSYNLTLNINKKSTTSPWIIFNIISSKNSNTNVPIISEVSQPFTNDTAFDYDKLYSRNNSFLYKATGNETIRINMLAYSYSNLIPNGKWKDITFSLSSWNGQTFTKKSLLNTMNNSYYFNALKLS